MRRVFSLVRVVVQPLALAITCAVLLRAAVQAYSIPSDSMNPTLCAGDHVLVTRWGDPRRGDVVVLRNPSNPQHLLVKRIVATAGDHLEIRRGFVMLNGASLAEPYVVHRGGADLGPEIVPSRSFFVLGDRRSDSFDSRDFGFVPREMIVGRAQIVFWSSRAETGYPSAAAQSLEESTSRASDGKVHWGRILHPVR